MRYRLIKSEPSVYSRDTFLREKKTVRDGVRSYEARNNLQAMKKWDLCFWYHSNEGKEIVGVAKVTKEAYPDPSADEGSRVVVEIEPVETLQHPVTLEQIKADKKLSSMALVKKSRLSVGPVTKEEFDYVVSLSIMD